VVLVRPVFGGRGEADVGDAQRGARAEVLDAEAEEFDLVEGAAEMFQVAAFELGVVPRPRRGIEGAGREAVEGHRGLVAQAG
jgi:hypothetical protein